MGGKNQSPELCDEDGLKGFLREILKGKGGCCENIEGQKRGAEVCRLKRRKGGRRYNNKKKKKKLREKAELGQGESPGKEKKAKKPKAIVEKKTGHAWGGKSWNINKQYRGKRIHHSHLH